MRARLGARWHLQSQHFRVDITSTLAQRLQPRLGHAVLDAVLLLPGDVHDIEGQQLAGDSRKRDVEVDLHALACRNRPNSSQHLMQSARLRAAIIPLPLSTISSGCTTILR